MKTFNDIIEALYEIEQGFTQSCEYVSAAEVGLDPRAGRVFIGDDFVATNSPEQLDYYGGFEYIDEEHVAKIGPLKVYSSESERVARCLKYFNDKEEDFE